jgi:adenine-specific DNA-methyltransferase
MPQKLRPSYKFNEEQLEQLKKIAPEAFKDGMLDFNSLYDALSDYNEEDSLDMDDNFYGLYWPGKRKAKRAASVPPRGTLVPIIGDGVDEEKTKNIYIEGDNLEVLKLLQKSYAGKIKMIYIDPPYNTGNDFIYNDDFSETVEDFRKATGQLDEQGVKQTSKINSRADGRFHSKWLNMMYPRLKLAHSFLRDDGVIFISIDDNEVAQLRKICDEIFGEENFVAQLVWEKKKKGSFLSKHYINMKEYILVYSKNDNCFLGLIGEITSDNETYPCIKTTNARGIRKIYKGTICKYREKNFTIKKDTRISSGNMELIYLDDAIIKDNFLTNDVLIDSNWIYSQSALDEFATKKMIYITQDLYIRRIVDEDRTKMLKDLLLRVGSDGQSLSSYKFDINLNNGGWGTNEDANDELHKLLGKQYLFDFLKPTRLISKIIQSIDKNNAIILDFFSGSSTTAHAVMQLNAEDGGNRQFIMVQLPEECDEKSEAYKAGFKNICEIGKERIRRAGKSIAESKKPAVTNQPLFTEKLIPPPPPPTDFGFKVYRLAKTNYKKWKNYTKRDIKEVEDLFAEYENPLVDNWKEKDLLTEIMLLEGFPLDSTVTVIKDFKKNKVTQISSDFCEHSLFVCLDNMINAETINTLALSEHDIFICLDNAVTDQDKARLDDKGLIKTI